MELLDILLIIVAVSAIIRGFASGLVTRLGSVAAIVLAVIGCRLFGPVIYDRWAAPMAGEHTTRALVCTYALLFLVIYAGVRVCASLIRGAVRTVKLGFLDRIGGALFSLLEWMIAASLIMNLYAALVPTAKDIFTGPGHALRELVFSLAPAVAGYLQQFMADI